MEEPLIHSNNDNNGKSGKNAAADEEPVMHGEPVLMIPQLGLPQPAAAAQQVNYDYGAAYMNPQD